MSHWRNPAPSSTRFCRPIRIKFEKETTELIQSERDDIEKQLKAINKSVVRLLCNDLQMPIEVRIKFELCLTMIDGKVVNAISNNPCPRMCNICQATPKQMNDKQAIARLEPNQNALKFGLSALHAYIRCFECILHISYRLQIKRWDMRGETNRKKCQTKKERVQTECWQKLGLLVDFPKDGGSGNLNRVESYNQ